MQHESTLPPDIYHATAEVVAAMFSHDPQTFVRLDARALAVANADLSWLLAPGIDPRLARAPRFALGSTGSSTEADIVEEAEDMLDEAWAQRAVAENDADPDKTTIPFDDYLASHGLTGADLQS